METKGFCHFQASNLDLSRAPDNSEGGRGGLDFASAARRRRRYDSRVVPPDPPPIAFLGEAWQELPTWQISEAARKFRGGRGGLDFARRHAGDDDTTVVSSPVPIPRWALKDDRGIPPPISYRGGIELSLSLVYRLRLTFSKTNFSPRLD